MKKSIYIYISNVCYLLPLGRLSFSHSFHSRFEIENLLQISWFIYGRDSSATLLSITSDRMFPGKVNYF